MTNPQPLMTDQPTSLEVTVGRLLRQRPLTLATAESCTGGLIGHRLTEVAGSSAYFLGGIIAYSNKVKAHLLGVKPETLEVHGAVSAETAIEMARGARRALGADIAVSVTGIAGPDGGTADKPIGLTYIALAAAHDERVERFVWDQDRVGNKWESSEAALRMIQDYLLRVGP
ncbi:nicotinamide-nucleotide amidase [Thermoflexales bacterium]|nr:nicotinamide-nucleotide amidase [Thermoflexales bacterium]